MKKNNEIFKKDLSKIEGTYTHAIQTNMSELNKAFEDKNISFAKYKELVLNIVNGDSIKKTPAQKKFVMDVNKKFSKDQLCYLVYNAYLNGSGNGVI